MRQRSLSECVEVVLELIVRTVVKETQRASAACSVVDNLGHHTSALVKEQFVANTYLAGRLNQNVPQAHLLVKFTQKEHLYLSIGLLFCAVQTCGKNFCIVEYERVALIKIVKNIAEVEILGVAVLVFQRLTILVFLVHLYFLRYPVHHHKPALVTVIWRIKGYQLFRELKLKL